MVGSQVAPALTPCVAYIISLLSHDVIDRHITPNFVFALSAALHVPVNGVSVHKLSEHVFHVGDPLLAS